MTEIAPTLPAVTVIFALVAAGIHVYIFLLESVRWRHPGAWTKFGVRSQADADTLRPMAYNQGFYNLFLAAGAGIGAVLGVAAGGTSAAVGAGMLLLACGSMVLAAVVLLTSSPRLVLPAAVQGVAPLAALAGLLILR
jgi:putative membrane protein